MTLMVLLAPSWSLLCGTHNSVPHYCSYLHFLSIGKATHPVILAVSLLWCSWASRVPWGPIQGTVSSLDLEEPTQRGRKAASPSDEGVCWRRLCSWIRFEEKHWRWRRRQNSRVCMSPAVCVCDLGFPSGASGKEPACQCRRRETRVWSLDWEDPLEKVHGNLL